MARSLAIGKSVFPVIRRSTSSASRLATYCETPLSARVAIPVDEATHVGQALVAAGVDVSRDQRAVELDGVPRSTSAGSVSGRPSDRARHPQGHRAVATVPEGLRRGVDEGDDR